MRGWKFIGAVCVLSACATTENPRTAGSGGEREALSTESADVQAESISRYLTSIIHARRGQRDDALEELRRAADLAPESTSLQVQLLGAYYRNQDFENALTMAERAVANDPESVVLRVWLGRIYYQLDRPDEALESFHEAIELNPNSALGYEALAEIEEETNDLVSAIEVYERLVEITPDSAFLHFRLGVNLLRINDKSAARAAFERAIELNGQLDRAHYLVGLIYLEDGELELAARAFERFLRLNPEHARGWVNLAAAQSRLGQPNIAVGILSRLIETPSADTEHYLHRTYVLLQHGLITDAGVAAPPNGAPLFGMLLQVFARKAVGEPYTNAARQLDTIDGDAKVEGAVFLNDLIALYGEDARLYFDTQLNNLRSEGLQGRVVDTFLARLYLLSDRHAEAAALLEGILARYGDDADLRYDLASAYETLKQPAKTEEHLRAGLRLAPNDPNMLNFLGYALAEQGRNLDEAKELVERALEYEPENGYFLDSLGWIYYREGDAEKAIQYIREAIRAMDSDDAILRDHFGDAFLLNGETERAVEQWRRALRLDPETPEVLDKLRRYAPEEFE